MKTIIASLLMAVGITILAGCSTPQTPNQIASEKALITTAAATGTAVALQNNPQDMVYFVGAEQVLYTVSSGTNSVSSTTVELALSQGGVTNVVVAAAIDNAITLADSYIQSSAGTNTSVALADTQLVCGAVANGIAQGIALTGKTTLKKP